MIIRVLFVILACALVPSAAWSQVYTWVDEKGTTVFSNIRPADPSNLKGFRVAMEEVKPTPTPPAVVAQQAMQAAQADALRREQALQARIANLEQQLQAEQAAPAYESYTDGYPAFGYPLGYGVSYFVPPLMVPPRRFVTPGRLLPPGRIVSPSRVLFPGRIVNSGPVFAPPVTSRFGVTRFAQGGIGTFSSSGLFAASGSLMGRGGRR